MLTELCGENRMKVLQINSVCGYGSTGRIVTDIYNVLEKQGHSCLVAYGRGNAPKEINSLKIGNDFDNYMHAVKARIFDVHGFGSKRATREFLEKVEEYNPDIIHLHNIHGYYINIELLFNYLEKANKPVVWTLHDCWTFTGHCAHFDYIGCDKWQYGCSNCPQKKRYPRSLLFDNSETNYQKKKELFTGIQNMTIVTPSKWLANLVHKSFLKDYNVQVINNGIDLDRFKPTVSDFRQRYKLEDKIVILGVASVWEDRKGFKYFLDLAKMLDKDYQIVLVGVTNKQLSQLPKNIIGIKRTNSLKELAEIYSAVDVFLNPTLEDNFPTTNLEALACGTPVVTFNTGGSVECIDAKCGLVVPKGDTNSIIQILKKRNGIQLNAIDCVRRARAFDKSARYQDYINLYMNKLVHPIQEEV